MELIIASRYNGPPGSANGGYTCGLLAELVGEPAEVTLRSPPPLETPLRFDGTRLVGRARRSSPRRTGARARAKCLSRSRSTRPSEASEGYPGFEEHEYATCFVCGPNRDDGLGLFAGAVDGTKVFAAPWVVPDDVSRLLVWAALDCPGAIGVGWDGRGDWLLGRMAAEVHEVPEPGRPVRRRRVADRPRRAEGLRRHRALPRPGTARPRAADVDHALLGRRRKSAVRVRGSATARRPRRTRAPLPQVSRVRCVSAAAGSRSGRPPESASMRCCERPRAGRAPRGGSAR